MPSEFEVSGARLPMKFSVRVWGMDASDRPFTQEAFTEAVSPREACIVGLSAVVKLDDVLGVSCAGRKGRFRVIATGSAATSNGGRVVLRALDTTHNIWGVEFPAAKGPERFERRTVHRYYCTGAISIWQQTSNHPIHAGVSDVSLHGCYVNISQALPVGSKISLALNVSGGAVRAVGEVCTSHPAVGMGVRFESMGDDDRANLKQVVAELAAAAEPPAGPSIDQQ